MGGGEGGGATYDGAAGGLASVRLGLGLAPVVGFDGGPVPRLRQPGGGAGAPQAFAPVSGDVEVLAGGYRRVDEADLVVVFGFAAGGAGGLLGDAGGFAAFAFDGRFVIVVGGGGGGGGVFGEVFVRGGRLGGVWEGRSSLVLGGGRAGVLPFLRGWGE